MTMLLDGDVDVIVLRDSSNAALQRPKRLCPEQLHWFRHCVMSKCMNPYEFI